MCGIAAAIGAIDAGVVDAVRRINASQRLRGPDAEGEWVSGQAGLNGTSHSAEGSGAAGARSGGGTGGMGGVGGAVLAFRRLKIIDLSDDANQPMHDPRTGNVLIFNGEIYNFRELRRELEALGATFRTHGDSEVILRAYAQWGADCIRRLRGMFALVLWDASRRTALVARDRLGIKPAYIAEVRRPGGPVVLIASSVRGLLDSGLIERRLDPVGLSSYVWNGFVAGPGTIAAGIRQLPPGFCATVAADRPAFAPDRYWRLPTQERMTSDPAEVRQRLTEAISQHLVSDVPLGVFLSGGKDSSAVAALAARSSSAAIKTFTITFDEAEYDESVYARRVAESLRTEHHEIRLTQRTFADQLTDALNSIDQPTFDAINSYLVSRAVKAAGLTVAMAGTGGDELFGGYRTFRDLPMAKRWSRRLAFVPTGVARPAATLVARAKAGSVSSMPPQTRWGRLADALESRGRLVDLYQVAYGLFTADFARQLSANGAADATRLGLSPRRAADLADLIDGRPELHAISALELDLFLGDRLLRDTDAASMEVSLEVRVPLLDHEIVESLFRLDEDRRFQPVRSKSLLSELALRDLPADIFDRPKRGFELPLDLWCRQGLSVTVGELLLDRGACEGAGLDPDAVARLWNAFQAGVPGLYWSRVWAIFVLLWWCRRHRMTV